jgi:[ribosomal protein S18]-alanine N-acetyltransferase
MMLWRRLFARAEPALTEANVRDAAAISALHTDSFRRGWSEIEVEGLLGERNIITHRATLADALYGFIMSRIAGDEAEILSVAVARASQSRGLAFPRHQSRRGASAAPRSRMSYDAAGREKLSGHVAQMHT